MKTGTIRIRDNQLVIEAPPHVSIRLRRLFGGAQRYRAGVFTLAATPEHAYDLDWFRERHPMELDPAAEHQFRKLVTEHERKLAAIAAIDEEDYIPREFELALPPRDYQRADADLALRTGSLLIASDLGTGKTVSCICLLTAPGALPAVIITMTHLTRQWERELARFAPKLRVHRIRSTQPYSFKDVRVEVDAATRRRRVVRYDGVPDVLLISYSKLNGWADTLASICRTMVADECQEFRHDGTKRYSAGQAIARAVDLRIGASATPIHNLGYEMFNVMDVIAPGQLGTRKEFLDEWCDGSVDSKGRALVQDPAALGSYLREAGLMIRRTRKDVGREIPPLTVVRHEVECDEESINRVADDVAELARRILDRIGTPLDRMQAARDIDYQMREATGIGKAGAVVDFVRMLVESGEQVLLSGWHHACFARGTRVIRTDGSTKAVEDVSVGDRLLGPDSTTRNVTAVMSGVGDLYRITPNRGQSWVCSRGHLLQVWSRKDDNGPGRSIPVERFAAMTPRQRRDFHMRRADTVSFDGEVAVREPWLLGYWLGDGNSQLPSVTLSVAENEQEVVGALTMIADRYGLRVARTRTTRTQACAFYRLSGPPGNRGDNPVLRLFKSLGLSNNKHIPREYLMAPAQDRRRLLAGLLDSDGHVSQRIPGNAVFVSVNENLAHGAAFLARSLGIAATIKQVARSGGYPGSRAIYQVYLSGDLGQLPMVIHAKRSPQRAGQKNVRHVGFNVEHIGVGDYFGFETDGDRLFLLDDFTIVHNCYELWRSAFERKGNEIPYAMYTGKETEAQKDEARRKFIAGEARVLIISNRSGAGLDGLQKVCRTVVVGELDWSPQVIHQLIGRIHRDGQTDPVMAYVLVTDSGSDPVISGVLGIKEAQSHFMLNPDAEGMPEFTGADEDHIRKLAEDVLRRRGRAA